MFLKQAACDFAHYYIPIGVLSPIRNSPPSRTESARGYSLPDVDVVSAMPVRGDRGGGLFLGLRRGVETAAFNDEEIAATDGANLEIGRAHV